MSHNNVHAHSTAEDDPLGVLEELVGDWGSESAESGGKRTVREISYRWLFDRKSIRAKSARKTGNLTLEMEITYFMNPADRMIRAWVLASDGSWSQADVRVEDGVVTLKTQGINSQGEVVVMTSTLRPTDGETRTETWSDVTINGRPLPDVPPIVWRRK